MAPPFVRSIDEYWAWLDRTIRHSGGTCVDPDELVVQPVFREESNEPVGLRVPGQEVEFPGGMRLRVTLVVNEDLQEVEYFFDYRSADGNLIWRKDRHAGHEELGAPEHIHRGSRGEEKPAPYETVDLSEVVQEIWDHQESGRVP